MSEPAEPDELIDFIVALDDEIDRACAVLAAFVGHMHDHAYSDEIERRQRQGMSPCRNNSSSACWASGPG
jgi:hypothetical protein